MADHTEALAPAEGTQVDAELAKDPHPAAKADAVQGDQQDVAAEDVDPGRGKPAVEEGESIARPFPEPGQLTDDQKEDQIKGLLYEREGYVLYGTEDQIAAVDAELKRLGHKGKAPSKRAATRKGDDTKGQAGAATRKRE